MNEDRSRADPHADPAETTPGTRDSWLDRLLQRLHLRPRDSIREELEDALAETDEHAFTPQERAMLRSVLGLHRVRVDDVMVPRADIVAVAGDATLGEVLGVFRTAGHSRLPVYGETLDDPKGMVHIRDFLDHLAARAEAGPPSRPGQTPSLGDVDLSIPLSAACILRPVLYVPGSMPAIDLLVRMQAKRTHMALVIDEYGGTDGLVSIENLVEIVVGDIEDEHDEAATRMILPDEAGLGEAGRAFLVDARAHLDEVAAAIGIGREGLGEVAREVDTIGGLILTLAGRVPSRGELIAGPDGLEFEVLDADPRRVKRLRIRRDGPGPGPIPAEADPPTEAPSTLPRADPRA